MENVNQILEEFKQTLGLLKIAVNDLDTRLRTIETQNDSSKDDGKSKGRDFFGMKA